MPLQWHTSPFSGSIWSFLFITFSFIFFLITFSFIFFLITFSFIFFLSLSFLSCFSLHVPAFSWMFLISLCRLYHIFSSVLLFVSSEKEFAKDLVWFFDSWSVQSPVFYSPLFPPMAMQYEVFPSPHYISHKTLCFSAKSSLPGSGYLFSLSTTPLTLDFHCNPPLSFLFESSIYP